MTQLTFDIQEQRDYFHEGHTQSYEFRYAQLKKLKKLVQENEERIYEALWNDFRKPKFETHVSEIQMIYDELHYMMRNLKKMMKPEKVGTPLMHFYSKSKLYKHPLGTVLIIAPWNYPVALSLSTLVGALAAGNCAVIKPSEISSHTSRLINQLITSAFEPQYVQVVEGEAETTQALLKQGFDYCFFTGSTAVGKEIAKTASESLTPVTLELGGKSPAIVADDASLVKAAARIVWGKFINAGQTCISPDYIYVHHSLKNKLILLIQDVLYRFYGEDVFVNEDYPSMINEKHFNRVRNLMEAQTIVHGGEVDETSLKISPTIIDDPSWNDDIMGEEIFGPLLPIKTFDHIEEVASILQDKPNPLALYLFTNSDETKEYIIENVQYGGGAINDTLIHFANSNLPFGGVGNSGMGQYHGKYSFDTFSHFKGMSEKTNLFDIPARYAPYNDKMLVAMRTFSKLLGR